jgi:hypothetical protein
MKEIKYIILYLVPVPTFYQVRVPVPLIKKLRFLRFQFHNTDCRYIYISLFKDSKSLKSHKQLKLRFLFLIFCLLM